MLFPITCGESWKLISTEPWHIFYKECAEAERNPSYFYHARLCFENDDATKSAQIGVFHYDRQMFWFDYNNVNRVYHLKKKGNLETMRAASDEIAASLSSHMEQITKLLL